MRLCEQPAIAFPFARAKEAFAAFCGLVGTDPERAFLRYLLFRELAGLVEDEAVRLHRGDERGYVCYGTGLPGDPDREPKDTSLRVEFDLPHVLHWMEHALGMRPTAGECKTQAAASFYLTCALDEE